MQTLLPSRQGRTQKACPTMRDEQIVEEAAGNKKIEKRKQNMKGLEHHQRYQIGCPMPEHILFGKLLQGKIPRKPYKIAQDDIAQKHNHVTLLLIPGARAKKERHSFFHFGTTLVTSLCVCIRVHVSFLVSQLK